MKFLIFGGSGFIGTKLCGILEVSNNNFTIVDKIPSHIFSNKCYIHDIRTPITLPAQSGDVIINLAAEHRDDVSPAELYYETNVNGSINICNYARENDINTIVFTSSVAVYGFSPVNTNESGIIDPFNDYGLSKWQAENVYRSWYNERPDIRKLVIIRPTVVFGEGNRGNVYNLFKLIASSKFFMVGNGYNRKSMAYVDNVAAFIQFSLSLSNGYHLFNYVDKPDYSMNELVSFLYKLFNRKHFLQFKIPYQIGFLIGLFFDLLSRIFNRKFSISSIRIKKFCSNSVYDTAVRNTSFVAPVPLMVAIEKTVKSEFLQ